MFVLDQFWYDSLHTMGIFQLLVLGTYLVSDNEPLAGS